MNLRVVLSLLLSSLACSSAFAESVEAPISEVTVYPDRAVVTRAVDVEIPNGASEIRIVNLTPALLDESVQVSAESEGELAILNVQSAVQFGESEANAHLQGLLDQREALQEQVAQAAIDITLLQRQADYLNKVGNASTAPRTEGDLRGADYWTEVSSFLGDSFSELLPRIHEAEEQQKDLQEELDAINREIAQFQDAERRQTKEVIVQIEAGSSPTPARFFVSYVVMNAGWNPIYNVRVAAADKSIQLDYQAVVHQRTGENWDNVALTLSTARPALGGNPPELNPWIVDVFDPRPMPSTAAAPRQEQAMRMSGLAKVQEDTVLEFVAPQATVEAGLTAVNLVIPTPATIPADNQPHRVGITSMDLEGEFFYTAVPKLSPHAYLQSRVTHTGAAPILPGKTSIFIDGNLVGHSQLPHVEPDEEFELPLGVDEAILVERKLVERFEEERGLLSKTTHTRFEYQTTITNRRGTTERIVIKDQVPVSRDERVEVEVVEASGGVPDEEESSAGVYVWELTLDPGAKAIIPFIFTVEHPEDVTVTGI